MNQAPLSNRKSVTRKPYHHGSLPETLLLAAENVLRRDGLSGLTLRSIAREAEVSHTAPKHHFGDTIGIFSELAAVGHRRLAMVMAEKAGKLPDGKKRRKAIAGGYIDFAESNPDLFRLMSRKEMLDFKRPALVEAIQISARALAGVFESTLSNTPSGKNAFAQLSVQQALAITAAWAYVQGLASLLIDNRLASLADATGVFGDARAMVDAAITHMQIVPEDQ